jgi:hypothetical protein
VFDGFEFPVIKGLEYLINENVPETDFLLINEPSTDFSLMFEKDFPIFKVPENSERDYCLFELKRRDRVIKFFCPEKHKNLDSAVWYFYMELLDEIGEAHTLPGQVRVEFDGNRIRQAKGKPQFIEVLEGIKLNQTCT